MESKREKALKAYEMRKAGHDWIEIAEKCGLSLSEAKREVSVMINEASSLYDSGSRIAVLEMELARLDQLQQSVWEQAMLGDGRAVETVLKVMAQRAKLLGLDELGEANKQAATTTVVVAGGSTEEYVNALKQIASHKHEEDVS